MDLKEVQIKVVFFWAVFLSIITYGNNAFAVSTVNPGSRPGVDGGVVNYTDGNKFLLPTKKDHSYYCRAIGSVAVDFDFSSTVGGDTPVSLAATFRGAVDGGINNGDTNNAIAFISDESVTLLPEFDDVDPDNSPGIVECYLTTLFGNFNTVTVANPFNFLEVSNDTNENIAVRIIYYSNSGTELARQVLTVNADNQRDIAVHDVAGASNTFGRILISHDGPPGGIRASVSKYELTETGGLRITATVPFQTRPDAL